MVRIKGAICIECSVSQPDSGLQMDFSSSFILGTVGHSGASHAILLCIYQLCIEKE